MKFIFLYSVGMKRGIASQNYKYNVNFQPSDLDLLLQRNQTIKFAGNK